FHPREPSSGGVLSSSRLRFRNVRASGVTYMNLPSASVAQALPTTLSTIFAARRISASEPDANVIGWSSSRPYQTVAASGSSVAFLVGFGCCQFIVAGYNRHWFRASYGNPCMLREIRGVLSSEPDRLDARLPFRRPWGETGKTPTFIIPVASG